MHFDLPALNAKINELEEKSAAPGFWDDRDAAQAVLREATTLKAKVDRFTKVESKVEDAEVYWELAVEEDDESLEPEISAQCRDCEKDVDALELSLLSEIKRNEKGTVEIKLVDRIRALERLMELGTESTDCAEAFFAAAQDVDED